MMINLLNKVILQFFIMIGIRSKGIKEEVLRLLKQGDKNGRKKEDLTYY